MDECGFVEEGQQSEPGSDSRNRHVNDRGLIPEASVTASSV